MDKQGRINILFLIFGGDIMGGSERLVYQLASRLNRAAFNPSVAVLNNGVHKEFRQLDIPLYEVAKTKRVDVSTLQTIARLVRDNGIQIVNAHHFMPFVY